MHIIEQFTRGKVTDDSYNEDRLIIGEHVVGVIDGSRGPGHLETEMIQEALDKAAEYLKTIPPDTTPRDMVDALTDILAQTKKYHKLNNVRYTGGFGIAVFFPRQRQIWRVGDCPFRYDGKTHLNEIEVEFIGARQRSVFIHAMLVRGKTQEEVLKSEEYANAFWPFFSPLLDFANNSDHKFGFGVINGLHVPDKFIQVFDIPYNANELVITSDGYPEVCNTMQSTEEALANILELDPLCINENITSKGMMPGQISFDDRTYLRIAL